MTPDHSASEEPDARDPLTCEKCGGPTKENGRWHPDLGAVYGYELGLGDRADSDATSYASQPSQARVAEQVDREALGERITELEGLLERALVFVPKRHPANYTSEPTLRERIVEALGYEPAQPSQPSVPDELPSTAKESAAASNTEAQDGDVDRGIAPPAFADADDDALNSTGPACEARSPQQPDGIFYCTRDAGHSGIHVAANAQEVVCRWPATEAEGERDEARAPRRFVLDAGGERTYFCSDPCHRALQAERDEARSELRLLTQAHVEAVRELGELRAASASLQVEALQAEAQLERQGEALEAADELADQVDESTADPTATPGGNQLRSRLTDYLSARATQQPPTEDPR